MATKDELITEIRVIYRDHGYEPQRRQSLESFTEEQLREHLIRLQLGDLPYMTGQRGRRQPTDKP
jgi:hypothetical protein